MRSCFTPLFAIASAADVQFVHLVLQRCSFQSEALCGSTLAGYSSRGGSQSLDDDLPLGMLECEGWRQSARVRRVQLCNGHLQFVVLRENDGAFDKVCQFPNVSPPRMIAQNLHSL